MNNRRLSIDTPNRTNFLKNDFQKTHDDILGQGSFGIVMKAIYKGEPVAVKILNKKNNLKYESIKHENNILGWQHSNIVKIIKIATTTNFGIIIMERFIGPSLQYILDRHTLPFCHRVLILIDITNAIFYCHQNGIIHLDLKPQNIMISFTNNFLLNNKNSKSKKYICKLCDFGCSVKVAELKQSMNVQGTVRYMAPESLQGITINYCTDIFSFGIIMWQLKYNQLPYSTIKSNDIVAYRVVKNEIRPDSPEIQENETIFNENFCLHLIDNSTNKQQIDNNTSTKNSTLNFNINSLKNIKNNDKNKIKISSLKLKMNINNNKNNFLTENKSLNKLKINKEIDFSCITNKSASETIIRNILKSNQKKCGNKISNKENSQFLQIPFDNSTIECNKQNIRKNLNNEFKENNNIVTSFTLRNIFEDFLKDDLDKLKCLNIEHDYIELYKMCWKQNLNDRPNAKSILVLLKKWQNDLF